MTEAPETILQRRMMAQMDEIRELKGKLEEAQEEITRLTKYRKDANCTRRKLKEAKAEAGDTWGAIEDLKKQVAHWQSKAKRKTSEIARLSTDNVALKKKVRALTEDINSERDRADMLAERLRPHLTTVRRKSGEVEQLQERAQ